LSSVVGNIGRHRAAPQPGLGSHDVAEPVIEYKKLVSKVEKLSELNKVLEGELRMAREKIDQIEKRATTNTKETDETLRGMRGTMTRLLRETDRKLP
jgi:predicted  nucleic acid-binding Zn-ribbon protein